MAIICKKVCMAQWTTVAHAAWRARIPGSAIVVHSTPLVATSAKRVYWLGS